MRHISIYLLWVFYFFDLGTQPALESIYILKQVKLYSELTKWNFKTKMALAFELNMRAVLPSGDIQELGIF